MKLYSYSHFSTYNVVLRRRFNFTFTIYRYLKRLKCCCVCYEIRCALFQPFFTERVFQIFDKDNSGSISLQEFIDAMHQFAGQSPDDKIRFLFKVYDLDGNLCHFGLLSLMNFLALLLGDRKREPIVKNINNVMRPF